MKGDVNAHTWKYPSLELLDNPQPDSGEIFQDIDKNADIIVNTLKSFGVTSDIVREEIRVGHTFTRYPVLVKSPIKISKVVSLDKEIAMAVSSINGTIRIEAPIPGTSRIGIEIPNNKRQKLYFKTAAEVLHEENNDSNLLFSLGIDVESKIHFQDIKKLPHLLIGGSTGTGKSILLHNIILSTLLNKTPDEVKLLLIDPKFVEFVCYRGIPHLLQPTITDVEEGTKMLSWAVEEMERRYKILSDAKVRTNREYNDKIGAVELPDILIIVDEVGDIIAYDPPMAERSIIRLAQKAKNIGIHLIISAARASADTLSGLIRANIPARVGFQVQSQIESRVIIDRPEAEKLLGRGDMLFVLPNSIKPIRLQVPYVSIEESNRVIEFIKEHNEKQ